jgi:hypothetical protein
VALIGLKRHSTELLSKVDEYGKSGNAGSRSLAFITLAVRLKSAVDADNRSDIETNVKALSALLGHDSGYQQFVAAQEAAREQAEADAVAEVSGGLVIVRAFAADYLAQNLLSDNSPKLIALLSEIDAALASKDGDKIKAELGSAGKAFEEASLAADYNKYVSRTCGTRSLAGCSQSLDLKEADKTPLIVVDNKNQPDVVPSPSVLTGRKVALVVGNSAYQNANELPNPRKDAKAIAAKLKGLGFEVVEGEDLDKRGMDQTVREFAQSLMDAQVALLFYAGHGMQVQGKNYLIPVDAVLASETAVDFETVSSDQILGYMEAPGRVSIALLDSCRNNPLARKFARSLGVSRSAMVGQGLAIPATQGGILIGFATAPGEEAEDGDGDHSPFTRALLDNMDAKGVEIEQMFKRVRREVQIMTKSQQQPWNNSSLRDDYFLNP